MNALSSQNDLARFGTRIREIRRKRGWAQQRVLDEYALKGLRLGAEKTLREWENGEARPRPESLRDLAIVLDVPYIEEMYWLGLAGYLPITRLPRAEDVIRALEYFVNLIHSYPYPAYILDYRFTYWSINPACHALLRSESDLATTFIQPVSVLDLIFDQRLPVYHLISNREETQRSQIQRVISRMLFRRHEAYFEGLLPHFQQRLLESDYEDLARIWNEENSILLEKILQHEPDIAFDNMLGKISFNVGGSVTTTFQLVSDSIPYFGNLFEVIRWQPLGHTDLARNLFSPFHDRPSLRLWELRDIASILNAYNLGRWP